MPASPITTVVAADDRFSRPLAVTVRSIIEHLTPGRALDLYVCDMGISPRNRDLIQAVTEHPDVRVHWVSSLQEKVENLPQTWPGITRAAYARLYIPSVLPPEAERAVYLDSDLIVRRCVGDLFDLPVGDFAAMAVADAAAPFVASPYGVPYWSRLGRHADEVNFNTGVLLLNLAAWRDDGLADAALEYLRDGRHRYMVDQEAINVVMPGRIGELDPRWNQQTEHHDQVFQVTLPYDEQLLHQLVDDPWVVHFTTRVKAWSYQSKHPFRGEWFKNLDETPYRGWRPRRGEYLAEQAGKLLKSAKAAS